MQIGIFAPTTAPFIGPGFLSDLARGAESRGFSSIWVAEHILFFDDMNSTPPFADRSRLRSGPYGLLDPFSVLSFLSATTTRIRLGTGMAIAPQRNPVQLAKLAASIDVLSQGRLDLGLGLGWVREEFDALAVPFEKRGAWTNTIVRVMRSLWDEDPSSYEDDRYRLPPCRHWPKPIQKPSIPIHFGGNSSASLRRVANDGQGWYAFNLGPDDLKTHLRELDLMLAERGRSRSEIFVSVCGYEKPVDADAIRQYHEAGADQVILMATDLTPDNCEERLDRYAETILKTARSISPKGSGR